MNAAADLTAAVNATKLNAKNGEVILPRKASLSLALLCGFLSGAGHADEIADFYRGKQIQIVIGYGSGGGYDLNARMLARHLSPHIPGNPTIVPQNMPGAGSLRAANYVLTVAPKDGTVIGAVDRQVSLTALLGGNPAVKFTPADINWIGTLSSYENDAFILWLRKDSAAKTAEDLLRAGGPEASVGGSAIGSTDDVTVIILRDVAKMNLKLVTGYPDGNSISLALERNEVQGRVAGLSSISGTRPQWLGPDSLVRPIIQVGRVTRHPQYKDVPTAREITKDARGKAIIEAMELTYQLARPYIAAQGIPAPRLAALRKGFIEAANSKALRDEAAKMNVEMSPVEGGEAAKLMAGMSGAPTEALDYLRKLLASPESK